MLGFDAKISDVSLQLSAGLPTIELTYQSSRYLLDATACEKLVAYCEKHKIMAGEIDKITITEVLVNDKVK